MEDQIRNEIGRFVMESPLNRFPDSSDPYFDEPLVGYAAAADQLFGDYKTIIGDFHLTPQEIMASAFGNDVSAGAVISWILPITKTTRASNRAEAIYPSRSWAITRNFGEQFNAALRGHLVEWLAAQGYRSIAPQLASIWKEYSDTPVGIASSWSERHAAYAAGLGTFSLSDALITQKGIAHRCGSVITELSLTASGRSDQDHRYNCLFHREGTCGICISRCPVEAISPDGHDKSICSRYVYDTVVKAVAGDYGVKATGCGLCQTKVPCESQIPSSVKSGTAC